MSLDLLTFIHAGMTNWTLHRVWFSHRKQEKQGLTFIMVCPKQWEAGPAQEAGRRSDETSRFILKLLTYSKMKKQKHVARKAWEWCNTTIYQRTKGAQGFKKTKQNPGKGTRARQRWNRVGQTITLKETRHRRDNLENNWAQYGTNTRNKLERKTQVAEDCEMLELEIAD